MDRKDNLTENDWLALLEEALKEGVKIQVNHRFRYKGRGLGTFLTNAKSKNKYDLMRKIENLGFNYRLHSNDPEHYLEKYIGQLSADENPIKQRYITRFNTYVQPKKDLIKKQTIKKLNSVWKAKFGDERKWSKPDTVDDKIRKWKQYRYDKEQNPEGKWFAYRSKMGPMFGWVYTRKRNKDKMKLIAHYFNIQELLELEQEGFLVD
ncbi:hypothetical protein Q4566_14600 [Tamlana sp. 2_MG-2023]|uniref:hypothetical protein n=1 Tax=unclassified Tamlana TaxID=2614803 RepID=UPI0026E3808F|nr:MULTISPECIES: hypothetical protein [unclassified Tamlana]MDO6761439.1 hypothetical protein [Tamlana sp. 2_MG-2023]MDO6792117.1 hypothetical protein [Tamlana sp. 1_MG-2023]